VNAPFYAAAATSRSPGGGLLLRPMRAKATAVSAHSDVARHLVIAYRPGWQSLADLNDIRRHVADIDPTIDTFIVPSTARNSVTRRHAATRPSLVVSNGRMIDFRPARGRIYQGLPIPKSEELRRLAAAGVPIPRTAILTPDLRLDEAEWGEFVLVKPTDIATSSHGHGFRLMRTRRARFIHPAHYPPDHPGRLGPMIVQQFIDTGEKLQSHRVTTFFGEPISALLHTSTAKPIDLTAPDAEIESAVVAIQGGGSRISEFMDDPDVLKLARRAHDALPEIPLKGCDILREASTGRLYVIELNCGGNTWHFSSDFMAERRQKNGPEFELRRRQQFDAMRTAARALVERTNAKAE